MLKANRIKPYLALMRLDKPIGIFLLLWPTLWGLWLAASSTPSVLMISIFSAGVILMRSAGCILNDLTDRKFDGGVARTRHRPLVTGEVSVREALGLAFILIASAGALVLLLPARCFSLAIIGLLLTGIYPWLKRVTFIPQLGLGFAFAWGVPMAFAATQPHISFAGWVLYAAAVVWPIIYDTFYALVDRDDDRNVGIKSTAILFGDKTLLVIVILQIIFLILLLLVGLLFQLNHYYFLSIILLSGFFLYQYRLGKNHAFFQAFLNNNWVGAMIFLGIVLGLQS